MNKFLLSTVVLLFIAPSALAVDLVNRDSGGYEVQVASSSETNSTSINAATVKKDICSSSCKIEVKGVGTIQASGKDIVVIENGNLNRQSQ